ncbi:Nickel uptake substrate-specific transmembrane region [Rubripirellula lacrimiformis]|uniref:Nickel uptake substrate-specific transmembrane region n=1 Tax=Rubripirellula lacrimiformis TaxID=1930273 RepID=A0A517NF19_9BACT|nr:DUF4198 domain-containing protein [Rubripirellula lacrimiformis]QDT05727.1 Nickel uptake substrate-specific transmembrane region [Rubripirellula lacrimiformis]
MLRFLLSTLLIATFAAPSYAHKVWLRPSQTVLSGAEPWVTVDAAVSNDLFYFNHFPLKLDGLTITAPDGNPVEGQNQSVGKYRSVFDLPLTQQGTYRIAVVNHGVFASYEHGGKRQRFRGSAASLSESIPQNATNVSVTESLGRVETFVTNGAPTSEALKPTGKGVELVCLSHPNDLYSGEETKFRFLVNGEPKKGLPIELIRGETRYRNAQDERTLTTDANGEFSVTWNEPGMYWLETSTQDSDTEIPQAETRRLSYTATLEVLPQ